MMRSREKAGGRYTVGFFLRLPAHMSGAIAIQHKPASA
jgi:hypothetical protein